MVASGAPRRAASSLCAWTNFAVFQRLLITFHASGMVSACVTAQEQPPRECARHGSSQARLLEGALVVRSKSEESVSLRLEEEDSSRDGVSWQRSCGLTFSIDLRGRVVSRRTIVSLPCGAVVAGASS
jgi:hypothetical protein